MAFTPAEGRAVVAAFAGGAITSDAGAILFDATGRVIRLVGRFAGRVTPGRDRARTVHDVATLMGRPVSAVAIGHEDVVDHDELLVAGRDAHSAPRLRSQDAGDGAGQAVGRGAAGSAHDLRSAPHRQVPAPPARLRRP
jgi:hypothetical protein